jgi:hypothetical protein
VRDPKPFPALTVRPVTGGAMSEKKPEHPAVKIASIIGGIIFAIVLMMAVLAKEYLPVIGWVVVPLVVMGIVLGAIVSRKPE